MIALRPYQHEAVEAVYAHLRTRDDHPCVVVPTAGGKTAIMSTICKDAVTQWQGRVMILAHVKELLEQSADKLRAVCPEVPVGVFSAGLKRKDRKEPVIVAGIQSVWKKACEFDPFDLVLVDECVPAGTMIATPRGAVPVESIGPGHHVCHALGDGEVLATSARPASDLVSLEFADGTQLSCTAGHPIFTDRGWIAAGKLGEGAMAFGFEDVCLLRDGVPTLEQVARERTDPRDAGASLAATAFLFDLLLEEARKPHERTGGSRQDASDSTPNLASTPDPRRERTATSRVTAVDAGDPRERLESRVRGSDEDAAVRRVAHPLQAGSGRSDPIARDRDRRTMPRPPISTRTGSEENGILGGKRVVRVANHQLTSDVVVYNLHVAGHPSYFANGVLVHNCHLIGTSDDGMYRQFLADAKVVNPNVRVVGFTATPFRMKSGAICSPDGILNHVCYEIGVRELIVQGYLCPLVTKVGIDKPDTDRLHVRGGEFAANEVEDLMDEDLLVESACGEIAGYTADRRAVLIFAAGVHHGQHVVEVLRDQHGIECGFVCGDTPAKERDAILGRFRDGSLKYLCNVNVLTTGFDAPHVDCVALLRPTLSAGLYYQMVGRGFRLHPAKANCLVLDFGGNAMRHGPVDRIKPKTRTVGGSGPAPSKECPECQSVVVAGVACCPDCGYEFPAKEHANHDATASTAGVLSGQVTTEKFAVHAVTYTVHTKRGAEENDPQSLRVDYKIGWHRWKSEWVCLEHSGFARAKAVSWWKKRSREPVPRTALAAYELAESGALAVPKTVTIRSVAGDEYDRIVDCELGPVPEPMTSELVTTDADVDFAFGCNVPATEEVPW